IEVDGWETSGHTSDEIISLLKGKPDSDVVVQKVELLKEAFRPQLATTV
ncbi:MAG: hypothetical protein F6K22_08110, partial [Okeania sp. SIO2F4]|nr:hypothetical protein [Okeania sp. SIO2F4]